MAEREPGIGGLRWFGAWQKTCWKVGEKREAYASGRGGRYQIHRQEDGLSYATVHHTT